MIALAVVFLCLSGLLLSGEFERSESCVPQRVLRSVHDGKPFAPHEELNVTESEGSKTGCSPGMMAIFSADCFTPVQRLAFA